MKVLDHLPDLTPFIAASVGATTRRLSFQRIIEAIIIGIIAAAGSTYVTTRVLEDRVADLSKRMDRMEQVADSRTNALQEDLRRIYALLVATRERDRTAR